MSQALNKKIDAEIIQQVENYYAALRRERALSAEYCHSLVEYFRGCQGKMTEEISFAELDSKIETDDLTTKSFLERFQYFIQALVFKDRKEALSYEMFRYLKDLGKFWRAMNPQSYQGDLSLFSKLVQEDNE